MDVNIIRASLGEIEKAMEDARNCRTQILKDVYQVPIEAGSGYEDPEEVFPYLLNNVFELLLVILEAAGLGGARRRLLQQWQAFKVQKGGVGKAEWHPEYDWLESKPLGALEDCVGALRTLAGAGNAPEIEILEGMLRRTSVLVHNRGTKPTNEKDIRDVMHDYLSATFPQYTRSVQIPGVISNFRPDGGVINLRAAIEFKFADEPGKVPGAMRGIFEDISGYSGSLDWIRFYSVIYQTKPFESEDRVQSALVRTGTLTWRAILVTGHS